RDRIAVGRDSPASEKIGRQSAEGGIEPVDVAQLGELHLKFLQELTPDRPFLTPLGRDGFPGERARDRLWEGLEARRVWFRPRVSVEQGVLRTKRPEKRLSAEHPVMKGSCRGSFWCWSWERGDATAS